MKRVLLPLALLGVVGNASAQREPLGLRIRLAYGVSPKFQTDGDRKDLTGPEIAFAFSVGTFKGGDVLLEPSFFGGGRLVSGGDNDGDVYRLSLFAHKTFGRGIGVRAGLGFGLSARGRGGNFDGKGDLIFDLGVEIPFQVKILKTAQTYADIHNVFSSENQLEGFFVGVGVRL